jgi:phosphoribosylformylglycinamidine cyclo-ligase
MGGLGGFGGLFRVPEGYKEPVLVSGTDGVGTKLLVAQRLDQHDSIGIDLVAMCVNDIIVSGAEPLFFLDYLATGKLEPDAMAQVLAGIVEGCKQSGCALLGGETAEMPGMYAPGHYDLAGFAVGIVERSALLTGKAVAPGHALVGLPSNGLHSNGFSLVRHVLEQTEHDMSADPCGLGCTLADELLKPTTIYVKMLQALQRDIGFDAAAHITGGGLPGNLPRVLPEGLGAEIQEGSWNIPPIFTWLGKQGGLTQADLYKTFNMGLGMVLAVHAEQAHALCEQSGGSIIGKVTDSPGVTFV